ncbi:MAG: aspartate--tRNA ligase [Deltaproteobacteria bacterium]|nr:aspartate--tRNA ligase [Deltaproteobacteria bacterium]
MRDTEEHPIDSLGDWKRTHDCGGLRAEDIGNRALLMGWVNSRRDMGNLIFIDLRDREGITQIVFDPQEDEESHHRARVLRNEWVVAVRGRVSPRLTGQENAKLPTGAVELKVTDLRILNRTETPPFQVDGAVDGSENLRLKYRYLELRRKKVFDNFRRRHQMTALVRDHLNRHGFIEVETPFLTKSTPEGARDYLVPSRVHKGLFYALPQSPQLFKQLLMISGFDRYYQIARCFRDEDLRADRQPEFTQVDIEMSFADEKTVMNIIEELMAELFEKILGITLPLPIPRMEYREAMERFGTDRPDLRFSMEIKDITDLAEVSDFKVFKSAAQSGGVVKAIKIDGGGPVFSRKSLDELSRLVTDWGAKGLAWAKVTEQSWQSSLDKFFSVETKKAVNTRLATAPEDLILFIADQPRIALSVMGMLRLELAARLKLIHKDHYAPVWVTKFPLLEYSEESGGLEAVHHPFTSPLEDDIPLLQDRPEQARARAYDIVLNGSEIGGGSVRIHSLALQQEMFKLLGISKEAADIKFGFFLEALKYGAPPHAGIALGFDRLVAIFSGVDSIREVIAFPKTQSAACPLTDAPSKVEEAQLKELGLCLTKMTVD